MKESFDSSVKNLYPGYFAFVMATGIVSIALYLQGIASIAYGLFFINKVGYVILCIISIIRISRYFNEFISDLTSHLNGPGFFTMVAGTCILGNQYVILSQDRTTAFFLFIIGIILWVLLIYGFFTSVIVREPKPALENGMHGGWFIAVVATQSVSVLSTLIAVRQEYFLLLSLLFYLLGSMLYIVIMTLVLYRLTFYNLLPSAFVPLYWVDMGAAAITTLAGGRLILISSDWTFLQEILPFLKGFTLVFWAIATWWIPLLVILSIWRHLYMKFPLSYDPRYWSLVFPLGMYTTSTFVLAQATGILPYYQISWYFMYAAFFAWTLTFAGVFIEGLRHIRRVNVR